MDSSFHCERVPGVAEFAADVGDWLADGPLTNNVASTIVAQRAAGVVAVEPDALWLKVTRDGELAGVVIQTPPRGLLLTDLDPGALDTVADRVTHLRPRVESANGPKETTDRFAGIWSVRTGCTARIVFSSRLYRVTEVVPPTGVAGSMRPATAADRPTVAAWMLAFAATAPPDEAAGLRRLAANFDNRLAAGQPQWIWEVDGEPVSFAMESVPAGGIVRLQAVYTPDVQRGKGYASALVARISQDVLARAETRACTLYTDLSNPTSNGIYQRIGYRAVGDFANYGFEYPN